jgi:DNA helicase HerA-like ATPase
MAEEFSAAGVPVFLSDVKSDLAGLSKSGSADFKLHDAFTSRAQKIGFQTYSYTEFPVVFWDLFGAQGHPVRTTVSEMGPLLLSRLLELSEAQEGILNIAFRIADEQGYPLLDLKDLQSVLVRLGEHRADVSLRYGNISVASVGAIQRRLMVLENQGGNAFVWEPALELSDLMQVDATGRGHINILAADKLMASPRLYASFLLWLLSELFETLHEVGDPNKSKLVFFFDEAYLLFDDAPKSLVDKVEQVARLIRSKGVGCILSHKILLMFLRIFWASRATAYNMRCAPTRPRINAPFGWLRKLIVITRALIPNTRSYRLVWVRQ